MNPQLETRHTPHNHEREFFTPAIRLLTASRWIYDLNMTELFCHDLFASFPASVRPPPPSPVPRHLLTVFRPF